MDRKVLVAAGIISVIIIMFILVLINLLTPSSYNNVGKTAAPPPVMVSTTRRPATTTTEATRTPSSEAFIFFGTDDDGIYAYSEATDSVRHFRDTKEDVQGVAYDPRSNVLYYFTYQAIHRVGMDGRTGAQVVLPLSQTQYGNTLWAIAVDWITGNLYGGTSNGYVFVCKTAPAPTLNCTNLSTDQGSLHGLALNPNLGKMYWTTESSMIVKADMDGSNSTTIVRGSAGFGVAIDYDTSRLYWADSGSGIKSSDPEGGDVQLIFGFSGTPWGLAVSSSRIYWGFYGSGNGLYTCTKEGQDQKTLFNGKEEIQHMTLVQARFPITRRNDCDGQVCSGICVLTPNSFRCFP